MNVTHNVTRDFERESRQTFGPLTIPNLTILVTSATSLREPHDEPEDIEATIHDLAGRFTA